MRRGRSLFALFSLSVACLGLLACETGPSEEELQAAESAEDWAWLEQTKSELDAKRQELAELQERIANYDPDAEGAGEADGAGEGAGEGEAEALPTLEELTAQAQALGEEIVAKADEFGAKLAQFINDQQIGVDSERTEVQRQAIRMKSDEDIELAKEYIEKGGDYGRAIDIYNQSLIFDPDNEKLLAAKAEAEELRYMTEERLAQVKKGMTQNEVRKLLGTPKGPNIREFDQGVVGWFYPKEEPHTAAGVFFQKKKDVLKVYKIDFNAVDREEESES